ncbi:MAG: T9SS type A sorting domain-containing protein [Saprospiraceae bacterium]|nr:T9SS type A sorting domain-containing protein [Saprospiraceae bacterium]
MPTQMIQLWASDFLQYTEDNCTPNPLKLGIRKSGTGTGFPVDANGNPITSVTFTCDELGTQFVELWAIDAAGNADYCETYVLVQDNAGNCAPGMQIDVAGALKTETNEGLEEGGVELTGTHPALPPVAMFDLSNATGNYTFNNAIPVAGNYVVTPTEDDQPLNGVSTYDLVLISKHILGIETLNSPYKMIAADANKSGSITTFDIVELRKLLLGIYQVLPNNTSWRFVDKSYSFPNAQNPFQTQFPENIAVADAQADQLAEDFVSVKVGDVNGSAQANSLMQVDDRSNGIIFVDAADRAVVKGEKFTVNFKSSKLMTGMQFTMNLKGLEVVNVIPGAKMTENNFGVFADAVTASFEGSDEFAVTFRATAAGQLSQMLSMNSRITKAEAYAEAGDRYDVALRIGGVVNGFELFQNTPNPVNGVTTIAFNLPEAGEATLTIATVDGRVVKTVSGNFVKGMNKVEVNSNELESGVLFYQVQSGNYNATKKMVVVK